MKNKGRELLPLILLFILFNNVFLLLKNWLAKYGLDYAVLIIANSLFFIATVLVYRFQKKAAQHANPHVFVRAVMGGTMIKLVVVMVAVAIYAFAFKDIFSKWTVFASLFLYAVYLAVEVSMANKLNKKKNV